MKEKSLFNIVLLGGPGSGKGTQAALMKEVYGLEHLSTGQLFRHEIAIMSDIGIKAKQAIDQGNYCSNELTLDMLNKHISSIPNPKGFIFDGVPRTLEQAKRMDDANYASTLTARLVINLKVNEEEIVERILKRALLENRSDDTKEIVTQRIVNYHTLTEPLIEYYIMQGKLHPIDGMQSVKKVFEDVKSVIDKYIH